MDTDRRTVLALASSVVAGMAGCVGDTPEDESDPGSGSDGEDGPPEDEGTDGENDGSDPGSGTGGGDDPVWRYDTGGTVFTVHDGTVYGREAFFDGTGGILALDASTGDREWTYGETGGYSMFTPPAVDDALYFGLGDDAIGSKSGELYAVEHDGSERWSAETGSVYHTPILDGGSVYAASDDGRAYAFDRETGEERWSVPVGPEEVPEEPTVEALGDGVVYATADGSVHALDAATGDELWSYDPGGRRIAVEWEDDTLYFSVPGTAGAVVGGEELWTTSTSGWIHDVSHDTVYVAGSGVLSALDATGGTEQWSVGRAGSVRVHEESIYAGTEELRSISPAGDPVWAATLDGSEIASLSVSDGSIYVVTEMEIHRLTTDGTLVSSQPPSDVAGVSVDEVGSHVVGDHVYVGTTDEVYALDL